MDEPDVRVLANDMEHFRTDLSGFRKEQNGRWEDNRETHKDLYSKLDRLPAWATLVIAMLASIATGTTVALLKG